MANIKSAQKRVLVNAKKRERNRSVLSKVKTTLKKFNDAIDTNKIEDAEKLLPDVFSVIDKAASDGVIHKNNAANKKSKAAKRLSDVKSGKIVITIKKDNKTIAAEKAKAAQAAREKAKAEYEKAALERKTAKIEAEKARLAAAEAESKKGKKVKAEKPAKEEKPAAKKAPKPKAEKPAVKEEKPAAKEEKPAEKEKQEKVEE